MIRKTGALSLRRTLVALHVDPPPIYMVNGHDWGAQDAKDAPSANKTEGFISAYNGPWRFLRILDPVWIIKRGDELRRDAYIGGWFHIWCHWVVFWWIPTTFLYADGKPPEVVDWNDESAGYVAEPLK